MQARDEEDSSAEEYEEAILERVELPDSVTGYSKRRVDLVRRAIKEWTHHLIDLGGRNNMLNYRDLKRGTLDLTAAENTALSNLLQGRATKVSALFPGDEAREDVLRRVRTIFKKASENFEERGIETLSLACGLATWENPKAAWQPRAPVLIRQASLHPLGAAQDDFEITLLEEMEVSGVLMHVLRVEFNCEFEQDDLFERVEGAIDEIWELDEAYEWIGRQAQVVPGFGVEPRLILANFAYTKLPMVRDLDGAFEELVAHDLIAAIAGDEEARQSIEDSTPDPEAIPSPDDVPPQNEFLTLDADASQSYAINAVLAGANLIIRGPPGTGKSQTIANLIGALAAEGKRVLFVAEKRAAIEAVLKRLRQKNLADLVVDLHGGISSRREFAQAIGRALDAIRMTPWVDNDSELRRLSRHRSALNDYAAALHEQREPWNISVYEVRIQLMSLENFAADTRFRGDTLTALSGARKTRIEEAIEEYVSLGGPQLKASQWATSRVETTKDVQEAYELVRKIHQSTLPTASRLLKAVVNTTGLPEPESLNEWDPRLTLLLQVSETLEFFKPRIFEENLSQLVEDLGPADRGGVSRLWASLMSGRYRRAREKVRELRCETGKVRDGELLDRCLRALDQQRSWKSFGANTEPSLPREFHETMSAFDELMDELEAAEEWAGVTDLCDLEPSAADQRLQALLDDRGTLVNVPELKQLRHEFSDAGLDDFLEEMEGGQGEDWVKRLQYSWLQSVLDHITLNDRLIGGFRPQSHDNTVADFTVEDRSHIETTARRIKRICAENAVAARSSLREQDEIVRHQARLKRRHLPVRELIQSAGDVLLALKPCWAMSPLVVSQLLPQRASFDVVIFDEASQITPSDAVTSIFRGRQLVVAGDERQLPPSAFFMTEGSEEEVEEDELDVPITAGTGGFESILDALGGLLKWRMLRWHYRSRDERLIAFSNAHIYDRMLTTFPGSLRREEVLTRVLAPTDPMGETNSPTPEVEAVLDLVINHMYERPTESLGVIAMGIKHSNRIEEALLQRLRDDPDLEEELSDLMDPEREERFFIKNLERVQGDERDAIILSIGYGKNARGILAYRFGPLLQEGGERRLNVAVTRAKKRMTLVSSFGSKDMAVDRSQAEGVKLLRDYLQYMESLGQNLGDRVVDKPELNPFEVDVRDTLTGQGLKLIPQYGTSGYWIDFAVQHPERPGDFVLAIECDGATYHSSGSARDRDRLRQEQLERLGWRFCRIWSSEWFSQKQRAVSKVLSAYDSALAEADEDYSQVGTQQFDGSIRGNVTPAAQPAVPIRTDSKPRIRKQRSIEDYWDSDLEKLVRWIESDGILRTEDELLREVMQELGFMRRGPRVVARITAAIRRARGS